MLLKSWSRSLLIAMTLLALPPLVMAQVSLNISVNVAPPELPVYEQPPMPAEGYLWTPGYWAWDDDIQDYYWVPGTWEQAPQPEYLWTPGYWGAGDGGVFLWNAGYWGPHIGFYGGVNYGFGYGGNGYEGGYWQGGHLFYNRSVNNFGSTNITNVYNKTVINNVTVNRVSYNGGSGGVRAQPTAADQAAAHDRHIEATPAQTQHVQLARANPELRASVNKGHPAIAATQRPGVFTGAGVVKARPGPSTVHENPQARAGQPGSAAARTAAPHAAAETHPAAAARPARPETAPERPAAERPAAAPRAAAPPRPAVDRPAAERPAVERPAAAPHPAAPPRPAVEQPREPEHTEAPKPSPPRPAPPRPAARPPAPEHPEDHEHH